MRRVSGRRQNDLVQPQLMPGLLCQNQMAYMNRIEGASKYTNPFTVQTDS